MKTRILRALCAIGCLFASSTASAGYQYVVTGITSGEIIPINTTRTVNMFLNYNGLGPANVLPGGLFSAWSGLRYTSGTTASLSIVNPVDGPLPNPNTTGVRANADFNASFARGPANSAFSDVAGYTKLHALLASSNLPPNYATSTSANNTGGNATSLYIGSMDIRTNNTALANVPLTLQLGLYDISSGANITTSTFGVLDPVTTPGSINFSVAGVSTGDYNGNGRVDAADYVLWRKTLNQSGPGLAADGNRNGFVDQADFTFWRARFGTVVASAVGVANGTAVPEPATVLPIFLVAFVSLWPTIRVSRQSSGRKSV
jgi:Dockerin type I domain